MNNNFLGFLGSVKKYDDQRGARTITKSPKVARQNGLVHACCPFISGTLVDNSQPWKCPNLLVMGAQRSNRPLAIKGSLMKRLKHYWWYYATNALCFSIAATLGPLAVIGLESIHVL